MTKVYVERRDRSGRPVERVGPFEPDSDQLKRATAVQMQIASLHNRSRRSEDVSFQFVQEVREGGPEENP